MGSRNGAVLFCALLGTATFAAPGAAQEPPTDVKLSLAQAENQANGLRQGMTVDEVQKLLGKPVQTSLKSDSHARITPSKGTLQWSYAWGEAANRAHLRVEFTAEDLESYRVTGWQWTSY
jgi:hypothetical protein